MSHSRFSDANDSQAPSHVPLTNRDPFIKKSSGFLRVTANSHRLHMLDELIQRELCVGQLCEIIGISQSALSQHLNILRRAGLVQARRQAQMVYYSCHRQDVTSLLHTLAEFFDDDAKA